MDDLSFWEPVLEPNHSHEARRTVQPDRSLLPPTTKDPDDALTAPVPAAKDSDAASAALAPAPAAKDSDASLTAPVPASEDPVLALKAPVIPERQQPESKPAVLNGSEELPVHKMSDKQLTECLRAAIYGDSDSQFSEYQRNEAGKALRVSGLPLSDAIAVLKEEEVRFIVVG